MSFRGVLSRSAALALLTVGCASTPPWHEGLQIGEAELGETRNTSSFGDAIYFGGQPSQEDFRSVAERGIKTVINLRTQPEVDGLEFDEKAAVEGAGMSYVHIPLNGREGLGPEGLKELSELLDDPEKHPVLLHCGSSNRVGYAWALFRASRHGVAAEQSIADAKKAGMRSPRLEELLRASLVESDP